MPRALSSNKSKAVAKVADVKSVKLTQTQRYDIAELIDAALKDAGSGHGEIGRYMHSRMRLKLVGIAALMRA